MRIQYCSDLHIVFHENMRFMKSRLFEPVGGVLIITGDVGYRSERSVRHRTWQYIADSKISAWIYGHSHHPTDMMIGNTLLVSNPLGNVFCSENSNFNDSAVIEV